MMTTNDIDDDKQIDIYLSGVTDTRRTTRFIAISIARYEPEFKNDNKRNRASLCSF